MVVHVVTGGLLDLMVDLMVDLVATGKLLDLQVVPRGGPHGNWGASVMMVLIVDHVVTDDVRWISWWTLW